MRSVAREGVGRDGFGGDGEENGELVNYCGRGRTLAGWAVACELGIEILLLL